MRGADCLFRGLLDHQNHNARARPRFLGDIWPDPCVHLHGILAWHTANSLPDAGSRYERCSRNLFEETDMKRRRPR